LIDWCLTPTLSVYQLYRGDINSNESKYIISWRNAL